MARSLLGEDAVRAEFIMDLSGSFAGTFGLMNEDLALVAGILGFDPADDNFFEAKEVARERGIAWRVLFAAIPESSHPNAVKISLEGATRAVMLTGNSIGGGMVEIVSVQGFPVHFDGESYAVLDFDGSPWRPSAILDEGTSTSKGKTLFWYTSPHAPVDPPDYIRWIAPVLPVTASSDRKAQLFDSMVEWRRLAAEAETGLFEIALRYEEAASSWPRGRIMEEMRGIHRLMHAQVHGAYSHSGLGAALPFSRRDDRIWTPYLEKGNSLVGSTIGLAYKYALGVNAKVRGIPIVPGPMGTGGGYLYSALYAVRLARGCTDDDVLRGLFVAAGIGAIAYTRTEPTGEVIGCAGECGVCSAMAAAAIVEMVAGKPLQAEHAASFAMQAAIGLPCDPIPGGYEQPCLSRIIAAVGNAVSFADLALAGSDAVLPFHEALDAADAVGRSLSPDLKCTSRGGCCSVPTALRLSDAFRHSRLNSNSSEQ